MGELPTNFKDDILAEAMGGRRRYQMIQNEDGTVSFVDVTQYEQIGSDFGQAEINQTNEEVNKKFDSGDVVDPVTTTELGFAADAKLTGDSLKDLNANMESVFQSVSDGKSLIASAITDKGVTTSADATFDVMAENIGKIVVAPKSLKGTVSVGTINNGYIVNKTVTFSTPFNKVPSVVATNTGYYNGTAQGRVQMGINNITKGGFEITLHNNTAAICNNVSVDWNATA